jgi:hypothetical protein
MEGEPTIGPRDDSADAGPADLGPVRAQAGQAGSQHPGQQVAGSEITGEKDRGGGHRPSRLLVHDLAGESDRRRRVEPRLVAGGESDESDESDADGDGPSPSPRPHGDQCDGKKLLKWSQTRVDA